MTISSTTNRVSFTGNGVTTAFSFPYKFLTDADLVVIETVILTGVQTTKTITTHYTIAGAGEDAGGTVTMLTAPASTVTLTIYRDPARTQTVDQVENDPFPVESALEDPLDKLTMIAQRLSDRLDRTLQQPEGDTAAVSRIPAKVTRASKVLGFDADGEVTVYDAESAVTESSSVTFLQSGIGAIAEDVQGRLRRTVFVTDFMSAADRTAIAAGTTTTIDTAVTNAHGCLPSTGGEIVFPPFAGKYKLTAQPSFTKRVVLRGMGEIAVTAGGQGSAVILKAAAMTTAALSLSVDGSSIQALEIEGEASNTGDGIEIKAGRCRLTNVAVYSMGNDGIRIGTAAGAENCNLWRMDNVKSKSNGRDGIRIDDAGAAAGSANANGGTASHLDLQSNTGSGLKLGNAQLNTFIGVVSQTNTANGIHLAADADNNSFFGGDPELNSNKNILIDAGATDNKFYGLPVNASTVTNNGTRTLLFLSDTYALARGLTFPATQVPSSDANTLDDYVEVAWTPAVTFATPGDLSVTYSTQSGRATKVGRKVTAEFQIVTSAFTHTTASGNFRISGLPFNVGHDTTGTILASGWSLASVSNLSCYGLSGSGVMQVYASRTAAATIALTTAHWASGGTLLLYGQLTYTV